MYSKFYWLNHGVWHWLSGQINILLIKIKCSQAFFFQFRSSSNTIKLYRINSLPAFL